MPVVIHVDRPAHAVTPRRSSKPWEQLHQGRAVLHEAWQRVAFVVGLVASVMLLLAIYLFTGDG